MRWCCFDLKVIFLVGNKSDLDAQRDVTFEEAKQFAEENGNCRVVNWLLRIFVRRCALECKAGISFCFFV